MTKDNINSVPNQPQTDTPLPDLTDMDELRKAIIVSEIINRKY